MTTLKICILFILKAVAYGLGLSFGFFLMGKLTNVVDAYISMFVNDREQFKHEARQNGFNLTYWAWKQYAPKVKIPTNNNMAGGA